jgi:FkbH-like protein
MKLIDALTIIKRPVPENAPLLRVFLACGFTPLHLKTFLSAGLRERSPVERIEVSPGLFGDLAGNIERLQPADYDAMMTVIEWQDFDLRLGIRNLGGWRVADLPDIIHSAERMAIRLEKAIRGVAESIPTVVSLPTLPLPPLFTTPSRQASANEMRLRKTVTALGASLAEHSRICILGAQQLGEISPLAGRLDVQSELLSGFPYQLSHASALADLLAALIRSAIPKKGLITDLDDTLWAGILGEIGVDGISWHLDQQSHLHGLYQQFLASLASAGILTAVASKNEPALVEQAFEREDLLIGKQSLYPIDVHWGPKSESVRRILKTWNIAADAVVFVDDSPMELAEVKAAVPEIECLLFPKADYQAFWQLMRRLRDLFGKSVVSEEDALRLDSIRAAETLRHASNGEGTSLDSFLQDAQATIAINFGKDKEDRRAFELINKTNQFNLNGKRLTEAAWAAYLGAPETFLMTVNYEDKYGALGKIAILLGRMDGTTAKIDHWVMSCRAFSRRIEHHSLSWLFENFPLQNILFAYQPTDRNGPTQDFFASILPRPLTSELRIKRNEFFERCPPLFHNTNAKAAVNG